jgi:hypothetical protein
MADWGSSESFRAEQCEVPSRIDEVICGKSGPARAYQSP